MNKFNYDDEGRQKTGGRNLTPAPNPPKTPPPSQPHTSNLFDYQNKNKVKFTEPFKTFGRCSKCDSRLNYENNQKYCGYCGEPLEWGTNE